jgi:epoxyqueuosine reductase QueG
LTDSKLIKEIIKGLGADLCGIAPVDRFNEAPKGFHPRDIYKDSKSVVVFAKRLPLESLFATSCVPYTYVNDIITRKVDELGFEVALELEDQGIRAVPIPSDDPYEYWEPENSYGRAILSLRHAGYLAGLGVLGKNNLLINKELGNMIQIGAVLVPFELEGDDIATYEGCPANCNICIESCPVKALDGKTVDQKLCRPRSNYRTEKGYVLKKCNECRKVCPSCRGIE